MHNLKMVFTRTIISWLAFLLPVSSALAQQNGDTLLQQATLEACIRYAVQNNPDIQYAKINEAITESEIKSKLADWYPQIGFNYSFQHNFQLPALNFAGNIVHTGTYNTSGLQFGLTQNIFNRDVLLASRTRKDVQLQARQTTREQDINIAAEVSKAFYDVILTRQQMVITDEDIKRIDQSLKDAFYQYQAGITDKTDYKRATISLNNAKAQRQGQAASLTAKYAYLKELMGYPPLNDLALVYDTASMPNEIFLDTLQQVNYDNRIEVQLLQTQKRLLQYNLKYYRWSFLPSVSGFANYNLNYLNDEFPKLYNQSYPNSYAGILLSFPIFQGSKRLQQIRQAQLQADQVDYSIKSVEDNISSQYLQALAAYKGNLYNYQSLRENMSLASEVYDVIRLQYRSGVKTYLDVITAETDLRTAEINYYNALYQLLSSKIDVLQSLGTLPY